jgi:hypothetical protein
MYAISYLNLPDFSGFREVSVALEKYILNLTFWDFFVLSQALEGALRHPKVTFQNL